VGEAPTWLGSTLHISQGLEVAQWDAGETSLVAALSLGHSSKGQAWVALPAALQDASLDGQPLKWQAVEQGVVALDLCLEEEGLLRLNWG
jgi:hypothetical protein